MILTELTEVFKTLEIPAQTTVFGKEPPETYAILTSLFDDFSVYADNTPQIEKQDVRISLYKKGNYTAFVKRVVNALLERDFQITDRRYVGYDGKDGKNTQYHLYSIDVSKEYVYDSSQED